MFTFFHGWRRKIGCVTLAMACVLTVGWIRSMTLWDVITIPRKQSEEILASSCHSLSWLSYRIGPNGEYLITPRGIQKTQWIRVPVSPDQQYLTGCEIRWRFHWCGFGVGEVFDQQMSDGENRYWVVPYWSVILPLTSLSAYLLVSKPRMPKLADVTEN